MKFLSSFLANFLALVLALGATYLLIFVCAYLSNIHPLLGGLAIMSVLAALLTTAGA